MGKLRPLVKITHEAGEDGGRTESHVLQLLVQDPPPAAPLLKGLRWGVPTYSSDCAPPHGVPFQTADLGLLVVPPCPVSFSATFSLTVPVLKFPPLVPFLLWCCWWGSQART